MKNTVPIWQRQAFLNGLLNKTKKLDNTGRKTTNYYI